jgi:hypothetical protein
MSLTPQQITTFLKQSGFTSSRATQKKATWQYQDGEPFYVNLTTDSGISALVLHPRWMQQVSELQAIPGVNSGHDYYHSSNMIVFPKHQHRGKSLIPYGLPITVDSERALRALLGFLFPRFSEDQATLSVPLSAEEAKLPPAGVPLDHLALLAWFEQYAGQVLTWEQLHQAPATVTISAKGIYKPKALDYALSIRQTLDSPYSDQEPVYQTDGSWYYQYAQEEDKSGESADLFTNQGLKRCMKDGVPVAVLKQLSKKPDVTRYRVLGLAKVVAWEEGIFTLQSTTLGGTSVKPGLTIAEPVVPYTPEGVEDNRARALREIALRQGQSAFRSGLLTAYEGRCAVTGCAVVQVLEAAHITPYLGPETNHISNGLLLRSDLHTLWDKGLIYLSDDFTLQIKPSLAVSEYALLAGKRIKQPTQQALWPALPAIRAHREWCLQCD